MKKRVIIAHTESYQSMRKAWSSEMEYRKEADLRVTCIANEDDFALFGITFADLLDRSEGGFRFLRKIKELAGVNQKVEWTNVAYTLQITSLPDKRVSLTFSERIDDYIENLKHSMSIADEETKNVLGQFLQALEETDEESARIMISHFEKNVRETKNK